MKNNSEISQGVNAEIMQFIQNMEHVESNMKIFKTLPIANVLNLEMPSLDILYILNLTFENRDYTTEDRNEFLEIMRFGAICFQLGFTFKGDGFGLPFNVICSLCNPEATAKLMESKEGRNYLDDNMPLEVEEILMAEAEGGVICERISLNLSAQLAILNLPGIASSLYLN